MTVRNEICGIVDLDTWSAVDGDVVDTEGRGVLDANHVVDRVGPEPFHLARASVAASAPEALRLLIEMEHASERPPGPNEDFDECYFCAAMTCEPHRPDCKWLTLMVKVGLR